jgi:PKD repeat protein
VEAARKRLTEIHSRLVKIMKSRTLLLAFLLLLLPISSIGAENHTLSVEFSFTAPTTPAKQLLGYRLYKEGGQVCETNDPIASMASCNLLTEDGTFGFTLTARYSDGSESPHSPSFPFTVVTVPPPAPIPPMAVISSSTAAGNAPLSVTFNGTASTATSASIVSYNWVFGDGAQATGETVSHTFVTAGTYNTRLTVVDSRGMSAEASTPVVVVKALPPNVKPIAIISASEVSGGEPFTYSFDASQSSDSDGSITQYYWAFGDGTTGTGKIVQHTYSQADTYTVTLQVTDDRRDTTVTSSEIVCTNPPPPNYINIEVAEVTVDHNWTTVAFENTFSHPVVVAGPPTVNENEPVLVRIRNVNDKGFEVRLQEWNYQNGRHAQETFSYMVIEKGIYTLDNGSKLEAGEFTGTSSFKQIALQQQYNVTPVILTQVGTVNESDAVTGRVRNIIKSSFEYKLQEMQRTATAHIPEIIGYIAWEPGKGEVSGLLYDIGMTAKSVTDSWFALNFKTQFPDLPFFVAGMQTCADDDTAAVRSNNLSQTATQIKIEEEKSKDTEVRHNREAVGYFSLGSLTN